MIIGRRFLFAGYSLFRKLVFCCRGQYVVIICFVITASKGCSEFSKRQRAFLTNFRKRYPPHGNVFSDCLYTKRFLYNSSLNCGRSSIYLYKAAGFFNNFKQMKISSKNFESCPPITSHILSIFISASASKGFCLSRVNSLHSVLLYAGVFVCLLKIMPFLNSLNFMLGSCRC